MKHDNYNVLVNEIRKAEEKEVASFAIKVRQAQRSATDRLVKAQKALRDAEKVVKAQNKGLKKFKKSGDSKHLEVFGV